MPEWISPESAYNHCPGEGSSHPAENFFDGNLGTVWSCGSSHRHYITLDLGRIFEIHRFRIYVGDLNLYRLLDFDVYAGNDPTNLGSPIAEGLSAATLNQWNTFDIPDTEARYLKLANIRGTGSDGHLFAIEVEVEATDLGSVKNEYQVQAAADDWYEDQACSKTDKSQWVQTYNAPSHPYPNDAAFRFTGITIPAAATVKQAILKVYAHDSSRDHADFHIYAELNTNAPDKTGPCLNNRTYTTNKVYWYGDQGTGWKYKFITNVIQELVDHFSGLNNANILIFFDATASEQHDGLRMVPAVSSNAARLEIVYTGGEEGAGTRPYSFIM